MVKDGLNNMRICFSGPHNLLDLLTTSTLNDSGKEKMSTHIDSVEKKHEKQNYDPVEKNAPVCSTLLNKLWQPTHVYAQPRHQSLLQKTKQPLQC
jgi:hypothetical protein